MGKRKVVNIVEDNVIAHGEREYEPKVEDCSLVEEEAPLLLLCNDEDMRKVSFCEILLHVWVEPLQMSLSPSAVVVLIIGLTKRYNHA